MYFNMKYNLNFNDITSDIWVLIKWTINTEKSVLIQLLTLFLWVFNPYPNNLFAMKAFNF